jgi:hypothetical protein
MARITTESLAEEAYPKMLMEALERAVKVNFELTVKDAKFIVSVRNTVSIVELTLTYTTASQQALETLLWYIEKEEDRIAESERRYRAKQIALSKLTLEERKLLGV